MGAVGDRLRQPRKVEDDYGNKDAQRLKNMLETFIKQIG